MPRKKAVQEPAREEELEQEENAQAETSAKRVKVDVDEAPPQAVDAVPEDGTSKRVKLEPSSNGDGNDPTDVNREEHDGNTGELEEDEKNQDGEEVLKDPRKQAIEDLAEEFGEDEEDIQVVIGPLNASKGGSVSADQQQSDAQTRAKDNMPAFRFSGASLTAGLWQELTPEMEEALRITGVNTSNYARRMNELNSKRISALDDDLEMIEFPRWKDPGAVQSDFFNYGLNEQTWKEYAARQVALRLYRMQKAQEAQQAAIFDTGHDS